MSHFSINSKFTHKTYDIEVYIPEIAPSCEGFPIYYVLDGLSYFSFVRDTVRIQQLNSPKTKVSPAIVIGICHQKEEMRSQRFIDFTAPAEKLVMPEHAKGKLPEEFGGAERFFQFINSELKPRIEDQFPVNKAAQTLFGHSLGGYFALWSLFNHPISFQNYISISPSVWWNGEELIGMGQRYLENRAKDEKRLFLAVGEQEGFMVESARKVEALLKEHLTLERYVAPEENHASVVPTVVSRAIRFCSNTL
ncbi:Ferri-bacillibactin esterase BesA [Mycobacteroides abscessus subsp. abscessus]|nr:Ferri-bacillibactin esterase BesA [Mycobacteroides abscessus subsp. abscessus]